MSGNQNLEKKSELNVLLEEKVIPIITLLLIPPIIAEILFGSTYLRIILIFIPEIGMFGGFSLLVRFVVKRRNLKSSSIIIFGIVFALLVTFFIRQTALAPLPGVDSQNIYGRSFGINWIYLIWSLGYLSLWGIVIPIKLFDLIFPEKKDDPLIGLFGALIVSIGFLVSSYADWYSWTQIAYPLYNNTGPYQPPTITLLEVIVVIFVLMLLGLFNKKKKESISTSEPIPSLLIIGITTFVISLSWFGLLLFAFGVFPSIPIEQPIIFSVIMVVVASIAFFYWPKSELWTDVTTLIAITSALLASMVAGFVTNGITQLIDIFGKIILNIIALLLLNLLFNQIKLENNNSAQSTNAKVIKIRNK